MKVLNEIRVVGVIGAGTMGSGIAQLAAQSGLHTILFDVNSELAGRGAQSISKNLFFAVEKKKISRNEMESALARIQLSSSFTDLVADVFIEAIIEDLETKQEVFRKISAQNTDDAIFCTNTSSIPITRIAAGIPNPERIVGMHFFNPAHLMKLVEIVSGEKTSIENSHTIYELAKKFGKQPVMVRDTPGFIVNRIGKIYHTESLRLLEEKIASIELIDSLMESAGFKMGPFRLIDLIGVDANLNVTKSLYELSGHQSKFRPSPLQQDLVNRGLLGKKSGQGFYKY